MSKSEVRFEPVLRGVFLRVNLALVDPSTLAKSVVDLNPHLDYSTASIPPSMRLASLGDVQLAVWTSLSQDGNARGVFGRFLLAGAPQGSDFTNTATVGRIAFW